MEEKVKSLEVDKEDENNNSPTDEKNEKLAKFSKYGYTRVRKKTDTKKTRQMC